MSGRERVIEGNTRGGAAFLDGRLEEAARAYEEAVAALGPGDDDLAPVVYENLGLARMNLGRSLSAARAFLRALDGRAASRKQSLRYLTGALVAAGRLRHARETLAAYEEGFGPHPDGWTGEQIDSLLEAARRRRARHLVC